MTDRRPPSVPPWTAVALVLLAVAAAALGATGPAVAVESVENTSETAASTTDGTADTVEDTTETTSTAGGAVDDATQETTATVEDTVGETTSVNGTVTTFGAAVNDTTDTLADEPAPTLETTTGTLDELSGSLEATTASLEDGLVVTEASALDVGAVASTAEDGQPAAPEASVEVAAPAGSTGGAEPPVGADDPLPAGAAVIGGVVVGGVALARGHAVLQFGRSARSSGAPTALTTVRQSAARWRYWLRRLAGLVGYQRFDDSDPLDHEGRAAIYEAIAAREGAALAELSRDTAIPASTVRYHLRILAHEGLIDSVKRRGTRLHHPTGEAPSALGRALKDEATAAVLRALAARGPDSVSGLADALDRDVSTLTHHLQRLEADGLVEREREGPAVVNRLAPDARATLADRPANAGRRAVSDD